MTPAPDDRAAPSGDALPGDALPGGSPLGGRTVLVARPAARAAGLAGVLRSLGARVLVAPVTGSAPPESPTGLVGAVTRADAYDWVALTSVNGVASLARAAGGAGVDLRVTDVRWAAVGPATATALRALGLEPALVASGTAAALVEAFGPAAPTGRRVLLPLGDLASGTLERGLLGAGWDVDRVVAYRTVPVPLPDDVAAAARERRLDLAVVAAGSAARELAGQLGVDAPPVVTIGEPSAAAARDAGLDVAGVAQEPTDAALTACVTAALAHRAAPEWNPGATPQDVAAPTADAEATGPHD